MKKLICFLLALCLCFSVVACGENGEKKPSDEEGAIDRYAQEGAIPEYDIKLGTSIADFKEKYPNDHEEADESEVLLQELEGETAVCLVTLTASFYYEKAKADSGISVIAVTSGNAFGLELGGTTTKSDIDAAISAPLTETIATADRLYFFPGYVESCKVLTAEFENYRLDFFMIEDFLMAVTLTDTNNWTD